MHIFVKFLDNFPSYTFIEPQGETGIWIFFWMNPIRIFSAGYIICCCWIHSWFSHDVTKIQTTKLSILLRFYFHDVSEQLKINFHTNFQCNVAAHPGCHQHGVSTSISLGTDISYTGIFLTWILARIFVYLPSFISQIPDLVYWTVLIFILIYFEWRDTENQQYLLGVENNLGHTHKTRLAGTF